MSLNFLGFLLLNPIVLIDSNTLTLGCKTNKRLFLIIHQEMSTYEKTAVSTFQPRSATPQLPDNLQNRLKNLSMDNGQVHKQHPLTLSFNVIRLGECQGKPFF